LLKWFHSGSNVVDNVPQDELPSATTITPLCFDMDVEPFYTNNSRITGKKKKIRCDPYKKSLKSIVYSIFTRLIFFFCGYRTETGERIIWLNGRTSPQCSSILLFFHVDDIP
jgi:hypothetical protein